MNAIRAENDEARSLEHHVLEYFKLHRIYLEKLICNFIYLNDSFIYFLPLLMVIMSIGIIYLAALTKYIGL